MVTEGYLLALLAGIAILGNINMIFWILFGIIEERG